MKYVECVCGCDYEYDCRDRACPISTIILLPVIPFPPAFNAFINTNTLFYNNDSTCVR